MSQLNKLTSGRFLLTIIASIILLRLAFLEQNTDKIVDLVELIVVFYFLRQDRKEQ